MWLSPSLGFVFFYAGFNLRQAPPHPKPMTGWSQQLQAFIMIVKPPAKGGQPSKTITGKVSALLSQISTGSHKPEVLI